MAGVNAMYGWIEIGVSIIELRRFAIDLTKEM
jgi:hypothetical protein